MKLRLQWPSPKVVEQSAAPARPVPVSSPAPLQPVPGELPALRSSPVATWTPAPALPEQVTAAATERRPKRDPARAVAYIQRFEARLGLAPEALAQRRTMMLEGASSFFRANPGLFHVDLQGAFAATSALVTGPAAPLTTLLGDPHLLNFGVVRGPEGKPVFAPNDFDQSAHGSPTADLARLAVSLVLHARELGLGSGDARELVETLALHYFDELEEIAEDGAPRPAFLTARDASGSIEDRIEEARKQDRDGMLDALLVGDGDGSRFRLGDGLQALEPDLRSGLDEAIEGWAARLPEGTRGLTAPLRVLDVVAKRDGGGSSLGLPRYLALIAREGRLPLVLELKELLPVALEGDVGAMRRDASMVPMHQRALGGLHNPLTGWTELEGRSLLVREREPEKANLKPRDLNRPRELHEAAQQTAVLLARSHARDPSFAESMSAWVREDARRLRTSLASYAARHADQVEADFQAYFRRQGVVVSDRALAG